MLFITRKETETFILNDIVVRIVKIEGDCVRIGIQAPPHVSVHREEVYKKIIEANHDAAKSQLPEGVFELSKHLRRREDT
jgi:carbon storage regulator